LPGGLDKLQRLTRAIKPNPAQLNTIWEQLRVRSGQASFRADIVGDGDHQDFLERAFELADEAGLLRPFILLLHESNMTTDDFPAAAADLFGMDAFVDTGGLAEPAERVAVDGEDDGLLKPYFRGHESDLVFTLSERTAARLQEAVDADSRMSDILVDAQKMMFTAGNVCRMSIDGKHKGTGVLVRPTLVATAGHVVRSLVDPELPIPARITDHYRLAREGSLARLVLTFGDMIDAQADPWGTGVRGEGKVAELHPQWLAFYSTPSSNELSDDFDIQSVDDIVPLDGPWDLALIRLGAPPHVGARGQPTVVEEHAPPPFPIHVVSHPRPDGAEFQPLKRAPGVAKTFGDTRLRLWHNATTYGGSSGAPCLDEEWRIIALHQAGDSVAKINRAVPIEPWISRVDEILSASSGYDYIADVPALDAVQPQPAFGRRAAQERIDRALQPNAAPADRLFVIRGARGRGKTFTARMIGVKKPLNHGLLARDMGNSHGMDAAALAEFILEGIGQGAGTWPESFTSTDRRVLNSVLPRLVEGLKTATAENSFWLVLEDFDSADLSEDLGVHQLIDGLILELRAIPNLRLVLTGWIRPLSADLAAVVEDLDSPAAAPGARDVVDYLKLKLAPAGAVLDRRKEEAVEMMIQGLLGLSGPNWADAPPDFYKRFLEVVQPAIDRVMASFPQGEAP
jgi:hypothetical protein